MELGSQSQTAGAGTASPPRTVLSMVPQKRKDPPAERDFPPGTFRPAEAPVPPPASQSPVTSQTDKDEYETGRVHCEACGEGISFRDDSAGKFTMKHWEAHRKLCSNASQHVTTSRSPEPLPEMPASQSQPSAKRRRAKRTEEERIAYLRDDPYVAQYEAYRVLCASCDKWIRLRPNSTYCSIPWDAHRKSCLAKRVAKSSHSGDDRSVLFSTDPTVRKYDSDRVQCRTCEDWVHIGSSDSVTAMQRWIQHKSNCRHSAAPGPADPSTLSPNLSSRPTIDSVPPPSKHLMALISQPNALPKPLSSNLPHAVPVPAPQSLSTASFKDLTPGNFIPAQESRRRNAEQREAALRADPLIAEVEPNRVFCSICRKWVQLRQDSTYCAYPWVQHRAKCLNRHQRRLGKAPDIGGTVLDVQRTVGAYAVSEEGEESEDDVSEESGSADEETRARRRAQRREEKRKFNEQAWITRLKKEDEQSRLLHYHRSLPPALVEEDISMDADVYTTHPARLADLETPAGRLDFVSKSVRYLFRTTYERSDELTIATLVTYLNAAIPPDKHEDFDTTEVTKAAAAMSDGSDFVLEGDVLRIRD
ncbi:hypothetical protein BXZ70DRAFT_1005642 [Cristinia sonorae]|uniref:Uncharacterized protein n=1 Tax=Cristinia sonorae TaxID=1940300 RepID=A0A8K0UWE3_9AGAR|nr:hypothetical protein BXZ70DRAFT_1005642 [Cristinia sonorae]